MILCDLSSNGTYVNSEMVSISKNSLTLHVKVGKGNSKLLKNGDQIHLLIQNKEQEITTEDEIAFIFVQLKDLSVEYENV